MDKKSLLRKLLKEGVMPRPADLERLNENNIEDYIKNGGFGEEKKETSRTSPNLEISVLSFDRKPKLGTKDFSEFYRDRFSKISGILKTKVDAVSINKTKNVVSTVTLIGMVKNKTDRGYMIEDETGEIEVVTDQKLDEDDVVAFTGNIKENNFFSNELIFPGIPFNRKIGSLEDVKIYLGRTPRGEHDAFFVPDETAKREKTISGFSGSCLFTLKKKGETATVLYYKPVLDFGNTGNWLNKRYLPTERQNVGGSVDNLVLVNVPDIIWIDMEKEEKSLHRGILTVTTGKNGVSVDMKTKEATFL